MAKTAEIPIILLERGVLFPGAVIPVAAASAEALAVVKAVEASGEPIGVAIKRREVEGIPAIDDLYNIGTTGRIVRALKTPDDTLHLVIQGLVRFRIDELTTKEPYLRARVTELEDSNTDPVRTEALAMSVKKMAREVVEHSSEVPKEAAAFLDAIDEPGRLADLVAANVDTDVAERAEVLQQLEISDRLEKALAMLTQKLEVLKLSNKIESHVKADMNKTQREYLLRQQLKAIQEQLGEGEEAGDGMDELEQRLKDAKLPEDVDKIAMRELKRLKAMQQQSMEYSVARTYLEWIADLPWNVKTTDRLDIQNVREVLEARHYGLDRVKKRIVEFLAVRKLKEQSKGPILCLVGPPGVGKTSLAQSVADAMGRKLHRISLGGVRDEAEIRGHRRTYVGALPGRIIQGLKKAGSRNPVFVLDEIDKLASDFRGDPSSALLEVLDPEQNHAFSDHYLEVTFDLSQVLFIATANDLGAIPAALRDRMEVIEIPGYTHEEKRHIAEQHLIPKVLENHGLSEAQLTFERAALDALIVDYTREAGVRNLERTLAGVVRAVAVEVAEGKIAGPTVVQQPDLSRFLGPERYYNEMAERTDVPGVATGLAWTPVGGDILFIEATKMAGKGNLQLTGQLGSVMKESVQAAQSYLRSRSAELGIPENFWERTDIHVHVPAGATPKDGPSAGVTMVTALGSLITGIRVRSEVAMTGEITLRGTVLPVGGIKEKVLAAARAGITEVILPLRNKRDLHEVPEDVKKVLKFHFVSRIDEVLDLALERPPKRFAPRVAPAPAMPSA